MYKFKVFGKPNCGICDNRKETIKNCCSKVNISQEDYEIEFIDGSSPTGMTEMCINGLGLEIPSVIVSKNDIEIKRWVGPKQTPCMKDFMEIFNEQKEEVRM